MRTRMSGAPGTMIGFTRGAAMWDTAAERCGAVEVGRGFSGSFDCAARLASRSAQDDESGVTVEVSRGVTLSHSRAGA